MLNYTYTDVSICQFLDNIALPMLSFKSTWISGCQVLKRFMLKYVSGTIA